LKYDKPGTLLKQHSGSEIPDFPTPRGIEQAVFIRLSI
jgi:hypothetical protein